MLGKCVVHMAEDEALSGKCCFVRTAEHHEIDMQVHVGRTNAQHKRTPLGWGAIPPGT